LVNEQEKRIVFLTLQINCRDTWRIRYATLTFNFLHTHRVWTGSLPAWIHLT